MMAGLWCLVVLITGFLFLQAAADPTRTKRLTAFGKSTPTNTEPKKVPKGKECHTNEDCETIDFTSCVVDKIDNKRRCLCMGNEVPINGECTNKRRDSTSSQNMLFWPNQQLPTSKLPQNLDSTPPPLFRPVFNNDLHSKCQHDSECIYGAECKVNTTVNADKMCYCKEGYVEENKTCNEGLARNAVISLIVFSSLVLFIFSTN